MAMKFKELQKIMCNRYTINAGDAAEWVSMDMNDGSADNINKCNSEEEVHKYLDELEELGKDKQ